MPAKAASSVRVFIVATGLVLASAFAGEPPHPLLGLTREQVLQRMGEPRSQMTAGGRGLMNYARERVVLRDGVVVDVERMATEPVRRTAAPAAPTSPAGPSTSAPDAAPAPGTGKVATPPVAAPDDPGVANPVGVSPPAAPAPQEPPAAAPAAETPPPHETKIEIKMVRPPSVGGPRTQKPAVVLTEPIPPPVAVAVPASKELPPAAPAPMVATPPPKAPARVDPRPTDPAGQARPAVKTAAAPEPVAPAETEPLSDEDKKKLEQELAAKAAAEKKAKVIKAARRRMEATIDSTEPVPTPPFWTWQNILMAVAVVGGGVGYMMWRNRQRQLELAASAVSHNPFAPQTASNDGGGSLFTADMLAKLEWKRFEELVEAYYSKTGVVAARAKGGPARPAQVKISWKGEPRPFALVRCIATPDALIDVAPLQELFTLLAAEDIRRGYVVTTGKFSVPARDYAEEKHLTLLPGDIFLEKLNALPSPARAEIMQAATSGDFTTPSCPTCEAKLAQSADNPPTWRCAQHADIVFPVRD
jgi:hypothetical protein